MRRRQRAKFQAAERERQERQEQEAAAELARRTVRTVSFSGPTLQELEEIHTYYWTRFIPGTAIARCVTLKKSGILTEEGRRVYRELLESAKNA